VSNPNEGWDSPFIPVGASAGSHHQGQDAPLANTVIEAEIQRENTEAVEEPAVAGKYGGRNRSQ
jgi:hypothetical protein